MSFSSTGATERLINAHKKCRNHLMILLSSISDEQWFKIPENGKWSIQRCATHIVNAELFWMNKTDNATVEYMDSKVTISDYQKKEQEVTELYRSVVKKEGEKGFNWKRPRDGSPSYHWDMIRTLQHAIYHMGMISNLRHMVGAPKLENVQTSWEEMVDSVFEIAIK